MKTKINLDTRLVPSDNIVSREINGEIIIIPIAAGISNMEDSLYSLNETGHFIWKRLNGKKKIKDIIDELLLDYKTEKKSVENEVLDLVKEFIKRKFIIVK